MNFEVFPNKFSVCKLIPGTPIPEGICFFARTDAETSLVCETASLPSGILEIENNWRMFRVAGSMVFSLVGILSRITSLLAEAEIPVFCISTYDTDYVMVKSENLQKALQILSENGHEIAYL